MDIKAKELISKLKTKGDRKPQSFSLPDDLMIEFKKVCKKEKINSSRAVEELIRNFLDGYNKK